MAISESVRRALFDLDIVEALLRSANRTDTRKNLRKLAGERLAWTLDNHVAFTYTKEWAKSVHEISNFHVNNGGTLNFKPSFGSIRDRFDLDTLLWLCVEIGPIHSGNPGVKAHDAVGNLNQACVTKSASNGSFGHPLHLSENYFNDQSEIYMTGIQATLDAFDYFTLTHGIDSNSVFDAATSALPVDTAAGFMTAINHRKSSPKRLTHDDLSSSAKELVSMLTAYLPDPCDCADDDAADDDEASDGAYAMPDEDVSKLIDLTLKHAGLPDIATLVGEINDKTTELERAKAAASRATMAPVVEREAGTGEIPAGEVKTVKAFEAMGLTRGKDAFDFEVPCWEWEHAHPHVPAIDPHYVFRPGELLRVLYAIVTSQRAYLHGHTGTGKTTLIEQVAARLNWPVMRVNFDSEITRMDLIGRDVLASDDGATTSCFVDGVLPQMMSGPYIGIFDEIDFVRPDVAYVMQRALEGNGLVITEDGGRVVQPHPMCRLFATGNTVGQGDEYGLYQGARPQSMAMLDRFSVWVHVDYMDEEQRKQLITSHVPSLDSNDVSRISHYVGEHLEAFTNAQVMQPISPRGYVSLAQAVATFTGMFPSKSKDIAITEAVETTILDRASQQDRVVLKGIFERVFG